MIPTNGPLIDSHTNDTNVLTARAHEAPCRQQRRATLESRELAHKCRISKRASNMWSRQGVASITGGMPNNGQLGNALTGSALPCQATPHRWPCKSCEIAFMHWITNSMLPTDWHCQGCEQPRHESSHTAGNAIPSISERDAHDASTCVRYDRGDATRRWQRRWDCSVCGLGYPLATVRQDCTTLRSILATQIRMSCHDILKYESEICRWRAASHSHSPHPTPDTQAAGK